METFWGTPFACGQIISKRGGDFPKVTQESRREAVFVSPLLHQGPCQVFGPPGHPTCGLRPSGLCQVPQLGDHLMFTCPSGTQEASKTGSGRGVACGGSCAVFAPQR